MKRASRLLFALSTAISACSRPATAPPFDAGSGGVVHDAATAHDASTAARPDLTMGAQCPSPLPPDLLAAMRTQCTFKPGALASDTVGLSDQARAAIPIKHVIVIVKENRSFDHLFGGLAKVQPDAETFPANFSNKDLLGTVVKPFHFDDTCYHKDPNHSWESMHTQVDDGKMDHYVTEASLWTLTDGHFAIGYFDETDFPFYYFLASNYAVADHYFSSVRGPTYPNRDYLVLATSDHVTQTQPIVFPNPKLPTIFDRLDQANVTWGVYAASHPFEEALNNPFHDWETLYPWKHVDAFFDDLKNNTLPSVVYLDSVPNQQDDHPYSDVQVGEAWMKSVYDAVVASPIWSSTAILLTYDEAGGFFDHVPPPAACVPLPGDDQFNNLGTRVPMMAISPWARRHYVSKPVKEHASILRFIEAVFGLPSLTARDANADALLDMFDFNCPPLPIAAAPEAGTGHCKLTANQDGGMLPDDGGVN
jgi:phospholipase C